ncbi:MAG TPA: 5'-nucleotidase C-terminal domain-containing protein [Myxococcaceae bacterium]|jgi:hypothetical protein
MNRRRVLQGLGAVTGAGMLGRFALLPPSRSRALEPADQLAARFFDSLDADQRSQACVAYDHPLRQLHNRGVWGGGLLASPLDLGWEQRRLLTDLLHAGLSEAGRERVPREHYTRWPGVHTMKVLVCGDPHHPPYQLILTGAHVNLRIGGASREGAAFGGPLVYGDQQGDEVPGLPGNLYRFQFDTATRLFRGLRPEHQRLSLLPSSPVQTAIQLQGPDGAFPGVPVSTLSAEGRALTRELISGILSTYPDDDAAYAWRCLDHNGGPEALSLSYYEDSDPGRRGEHQNFRLEGPAAVLYFRGDPHVHAFASIAMDASACSVGERIGENPAPLEGPGIQRLFEAAMLDQSGADLAFYNPDAVAGRLRRGTIREGDLYALEVWQDSTARVEIKGANMAPTLVESLRGAGKSLDPRRTYAVATTGHVAREEAAEHLGQPDAVDPGPLLRDVAIAYLKKHGFPVHG